MSEDWAEVRLGDLITIKHGWPFASEFFSAPSDGLPIVVGIGNFNYTGGFRFDSTTLKAYTSKFPDEYILKPNDTLLVMTCQTAGGEILGIPGRIPDDGRTYLHNQRMGKVVIKQPEKIDQGFLYWLFLTKEFNWHLVVSASGTKILHTAPTRIESYRFRLPPLPIQRRIADILGALDDKIECNRRINQTLETMANTFFKHWFWDSDNGWESKPFDEVATFLNGLALQKYPPKDGASLPVIKIAELHRGTTESSDCASADIPSKYIVGDGDILFSWSGSLDVCVWCNGRGALNQHLFKVTSAEYPKWFYYQWIKYHLPEFRAIAAGKATTMGHIQREHLHQASVIIPSQETLQMMNAKMQPLLDQIISNNLESQTLTHTRDYLLPKLLSGEVEVKPA